MPDSMTMELEVEGFRSFTQHLIKGMDKRGAKKALRAVAFRFLRKVILKTPVDEGRARGGWASYLLANDLPFPVRSTAGVSGGSTKNINDPAIAEGLAASSFEEEFRGVDQFIILVNAVEYVVLLEFGSSKQSSGGMMRVSFRELQAGKDLTEEVQKQLVKEIATANRKAKSARIAARAGKITQVSRAGS